MSDIAIVGIGCRYAGGIDSPESFWDFIINKRDGVVDIPAQRWDYRRYYDPDRRTPGRMYTKRAAFLTGDPWAFDPDFFGISPREAAAMDPQQRLVLEVAWEALDDAGFAGRVTGAPIGVYVGAFTLDQLAVSTTNAALPYVDMHTAVGASYTMLSNRIAYALNMVGPAMTVDTACSSSLVALHLACQALDAGDCTVALAGGVTMLMQPEPFVSMCKGGFLAADGRSKPFDASADGYGRGEGSGMVVLKKLEDAERDGDRVYAVIKATGSNQDGRTTAITVPNADLQEALAKSVTERAGIGAHEVTYVEAHGTGTPVGDPLELRAIGRAYGQVEGRTAPVGVGSVKAQLGHTEAASGIAGIIKSALAISKRTLAPQGWLETPNPDIPFEELGIRLQLEAEEIGAEIERITIAVNGFGYGGTNAHAILQEHVPAVGSPLDQGGVEGGLRPQTPVWGQSPQTPIPGQSPQAPIPGQSTQAATGSREPRNFGVLPLSARSENAAREIARGYAELIAAGAEPAWLAEGAWTRRQHHQFRTAVTFADDAELVEALVEFAAGSGRGASKVVARKAPEPVFVFTGMGPQWWGMGRELLRGGGTFAAEAERIDAVFREISGWSIVAELLRPEEESRVTSTAVAQPANFLVQVALYAMLGELGIRPAAVVGHSVGEVSAAYVTGMLSLRDALTVSYHRARLQATTAGSGGMLAVGLSPAAALELIDGDELVDIAAINSPSAVTLAGAQARLDEIAETLTADGVFAKRLFVEVPYHSYLMEPILGELRTALADLTLAEPTLPLWSTVTGQRVTAGDWNAEYWCANVRQPVRFADALTDLVGAGHRVYLEVGPHPVLGANIREILIGAGESGTSVATLNRKQNDAESLRQTVAGLYTAGALDIDALFADTVTPHVELPRYPWQRTPLRNANPVFQQRKYGSPEIYAMLGDPDLDSPSNSWRIQLSVGAMPWLADHVVGGARILPGAGYLDAALSAVALRTESTRVAVEDVRFIAPLIIDEGNAPLAELQVEESTGRFTIRSRSVADAPWTTHATGRLIEGSFESGKVEVPDVDEMHVIDPAAFYAGLAARGLEYGPAFQRATAVRISGATVVATLDGGIAQDSGHLAHPCVVDAALQSVAALLAGSGSADDGAMVPVAVAGVRAFAPIPEQVTVVARLSTDGAPTADIDLLDAEQNVVLQLIGMRFGSIAPGRGALQRMTDIFYEDRWEMREPVDRSGLPATGPAYTLVVEFGSAASARATTVAATTPRSEILVLGDPQRTDLEDAVRERLRAAVAEEGVERLHIALVAGTEYADLDSLWTLRRLAVTFDEFLDEWLERRGAEIPMTGDGSMHVSLITEHAYAHPDEDAAPNPAHAALAGARRVLLNEQPRLRWRLVDVEADVDATDLAAELAVPGAFAYDNSDEVFLRNGLRWVTVVEATLQGRLDALEQAVPLEDPEANFTLELPKSRTLSRLGWRRTARREPGPNEVEVRMRAVGLNYKDPLKVIGVLAEEEMAGTFFGTLPGMEGDGVVVRVGADVHDLAAGDHVTLTSKGMISRFHTTDRDLLIKTPDDSEAGFCTSGTAFSTAEYSLLELARVRAGDVVLVHGAAGGVGSAAVQIAKLRGASVIGTASTDERRAYVLEQGADHVLDSRSLNFADDVLGLTDGRGADVIISTAPGEILRRNFKAVAEFGRIVEIGKADIYGGGLLDLRYFDKNISYHSFDLDRMLRLRRRETIELITRVNAALAAGTYRRLPFEVYETDDVARAFEDVARSAQLGRIAVSLESAAPLVRPSTRAVTVDPAAQYVITGGFGAFGLAVGRWLVGKGARRLTLLGRSGASTDEARNLLSEWETQGVTVTTERVDVTDAEAITAVIGRAHSPEHPLRGVFHTAGVVDDKRVSVMDRDSLASVYRPKIEGVRALRRGIASAGAELDMFVLFSSGSAIFGGVGQYSYTAANLALQAVADQVARDGGEVLAVGWGHMAGGMAADENVARYLRTTGFDSIDMDEGTEFLEQALTLDIHHQAAIIPIDWKQVAASVPFFTQTGRVQERIAAAAEDDSAASHLVVALRELEEAQRNDVVAHMLAEQLAAVMGVDAESIDLTVPVTDLGLDSLMAVEFGALVGKSLGVDLSALRLGRSFTLAQAGARAAEFLIGAPAAEVTA
ncbi:SDR family NAD(P)-dependent oxidoreductase [Nocardia sp. 2]|uniref:SDR family NAD(P)-dependent oxidoreductase n=1 Tax=Nocardia acididurans TaxID=2802282 RepID=A0ABS1MC82_9NOCA|nr:type I polyketide synthase [Nocardia acididurans]MBL1078252.1 SDR family NAD(P)-dependent oxidoreductase [Nocardia acididurans]